MSLDSAKVWAIKNNSEINIFGVLFVCDYLNETEMDSRSVATLLSGNLKICFHDDQKEVDIVNLSVNSFPTVSQRCCANLGLSMEPKNNKEKAVGVKAYSVLMKPNFQELFKVGEIVISNAMYDFEFDFNSIDSNSELFSRVSPVDNLANDYPDSINSMTGITPPEINELINICLEGYNIEEVYPIDELLSNSNSLFSDAGREELNSIIKKSDDSLGEEVFRLSGERYYPRMIAGVVDYVFGRRLKKMGKSLSLIGEPGSGKTAFVDAAFPDRIEIMGHENLRAEDLIGRLVQDKETGIWGWQDGPLTRGAKMGKTVYIDEAGKIRGNVMGVVNPYTDERGVIEDPNPLDNTDEAGNAKKIEFAEGFHVVISWNPHVKGSDMPLDLKSRFVTVNWPTDYNLALHMGVPMSFVDFAVSLYNGRLTGESIDWVPQMRHLLRARDMAKNFGVPFALAEMVNQIPSENTKILICQNYIPRYFTSQMDRQYIEYTDSYAIGLSATDSITDIE